MADHNSTMDWGATDGPKWDDGSFSAVKQIIVYLFENKSVIKGIQFTYMDENGVSITKPKHGGDGGDGDNMEINIDIDGGEYLTKVSGYYGHEDEKNDCGVVIIRSLTFYSNLKTYGPYGDEDYGTNFITSEGDIVGFNGRTDTDDTYLTAIGVHVISVDDNDSDSNASVDDDSGSTETEWDDGTFPGVKNIVVYFDDQNQNVINGIQITYFDMHGVSVIMPKHGGGSDANTKEINLDYDGGEHLTKVSGYYGDKDKGKNRNCKVNIIRSLKFKSNLKTYGPYGDVDYGTKFTTSKGEVVGFNGKIDTDYNYLTAIDVHLQPVYL